jgi:putative tricarboxylic transport membrane protein
MILTPVSLLVMVLGVAVGIIFGAIPGLSAAMAVALFLPVTFSMAPNLGFTLLVALYIGAISGGLISAILLKMPGTASSIATCFDGCPMAQRGEASKALGVGIFFSFIGGLLSFIVLIFIAPPLAKLALKFSAIEYFAVTFFALTMIAVLASGSFLKGLLSGMLGLIMAAAGMAPIDGIPRFTFGIEELTSGFDVLPTLIGIFAIAEILSTAEKLGHAKSLKAIELQPIKGFGFSWREFWGQKWNCLRSAAIGLFVGLLPGIGGSTSNIMSYVAAKNQSKYPEKFGTGIIDGIVASETANNATIGGAMIPLLALGIPGDGVTAMMLGGFMIHGLTPGPLLFQSSGDLVYGIFAACMVANVVMLLLEFFGIRVFVKLLKIPKHILMPIILVMCAVGAFAVNNRVFDMQSIIVFGIIGYLLQKFKLSSSPFVLSFILGSLIETNLRRGLMLTGGSFLAFFSQPIATIFIAIGVLTLLGACFKEIKQMKASKEVTGV